MLGSRLRRSIALLTTAALLASLTAATVATPAGAAKKAKCRGQVATIVGTRKADRIVGTNRRDVIVAKGGNDIVVGRGGNDLICGGPGADRLVGQGGVDLLFGNAGPDRLFGGNGPDRLLGGTGNDVLAGQVGPDLLNGGPGIDTCYQGQGSGPQGSCERPAAPSGPSLIPLDGILVVAYSDIDGLDGYSTGDVLISQLVDTDGNGLPSASDTIVMGRYPTDLAASAFGDWGVKSHTLTDATVTTTLVQTISAAGDHHWGNRPAAEYYYEFGGPEVVILDGIASPTPETFHIVLGAPSGPQTAVPLAEPERFGDDRFIDVDFNFVAP